MTNIANLLTEHMDIWTAADTEKKSGRGRASGSAGSVYGVKKLRELILELAVLGKLVKVDNLYFNKFTLGEIGEWGSGGTPLKSQHEFYNGNIPWLVIGDLNDGLVLDSETKITKLGLENSSAKVVPIGTLLIAMYGSIGKLGVAGIECATNQAIAFCIPNNNIVLTNYLFLYLRSIREKLLARGQGLAQQNISQKILKATLVSFPPISEQHRIVAKVDELMALCDQLEQQHSNSAEAHEKLVSHLLGTLTQSQSADDFTINWQRISAHFDTLFTTEASIDSLKKTLLQLAVMGKLVTQDANDEPASELLKRIQTEKTKLVAEGKIKKEKPLAPIGEGERPFEVPSNWEWVRLADLLAIVTDGDHQAPPKSDSGIPFLVIGNLNAGSISIENCRFVPEQYFEKLDWIKKPLIDDLLYTVTGSYGIPIKVENSQQFCVQRHVAILKSTKSTPVNYLVYLLKSKYAFEYATKIATGIAQKTVPLTGLRMMTVPIPSELEQHRIVAKVDELMTLCDKLKTRINESNQQQQAIADALVARAVV